MLTAICTALLSAMTQCGHSPLADRPGPLAPTVRPFAVQPAGQQEPAAGVWPLDPQPSVQRPFDPPPQPWLPGHRGVDLLGQQGQAVRSATAGSVAFSGVIAGRGVITVRLANGWRTSYEPVTSPLAVGTPVQAGQQLATLAATPSHCAPAVCLHWGLIVGDRLYRDPLLLLGTRTVILLPVR